MKNKEGLLSIVIPSYNEEKDILDCLNSLLNQSYKNFEIIVIDDGSTDKTKEVVRSFQKRNKKIKIFEKNHKGPGIARNFGAKNAKGEILIFIDADMTFDKDYLKNLIKPIINNKEIIGTTHNYEIATNIDNIWARCWGKTRITKKYLENPAIFRAIRKDKFLERGGFDPKYGYADDQTFWFKFKIKPIYAKGSKCYHKNPENLKSVYNQSRWIGASIEHKIFNVFLIRYFVPLFMIVFSPAIIPSLTINKCYKNKDWRIFLYMFIFMFYRYFGTIEGVINKIYFKKNIK